MEIDGVKYSFQIASDVIRDGLGFECYCDVDGNETLVLEVFRNDGKRRFEVSQYVDALPLELYEYVISEARGRLGSFVP
jgi:hypothetical protein